MVTLKKENPSLLANAFGLLAQGKCILETYLQRVSQASTFDASYLVNAKEKLNFAVDKLRQAGYQDELPRGLLARAAWARVAQQFDRATSDLVEVRSIAERGEMRLHFCDYHLESARLYLAQGNKDKAREHSATAREMVAQMGYHRRDKEVEEIAAQLG